MPIDFRKAEFFKSAASPAQFVHDARPKIVFAGRSNVGKSSLINSLTGVKGLARVGNTPGKTAYANYFLIDKSLWFVDLPGYGYAKVSREEKKRWGILMEEFFADPENFRLGCMIVDIRHTPSKDDRTMADYFRNSGKPFVIAANKRDKIKDSQAQERLDDIKGFLSLGEGVPLVPFSSTAGSGKKQLIGEMLKLCE